MDESYHMRSFFRGLTKRLRSKVIDRKLYNPESYAKQDYKKVYEYVKEVAEQDLLKERMEDNLDEDYEKKKLSAIGKIVQYTVPSSDTYRFALPVDPSFTRDTEHRNPEVTPRVTFAPSAIENLGRNGGRMMTASLSKNIGEYDIVKAMEKLSLNFATTEKLNEVNVTIANMNNKLKQLVTVFNV